MKEWIIIALLGIGPILWMIGGTGYKWARRIVYPIAAAILAVLFGARILNAAVMGLLLAAVLTLPYGDRTSWPVRIIVFTSYAIPSWAIHFLWWMPLLTGAVLTLVMLASRRLNFVTHKIWEGSAGFVQSASIVMAMLA